MTVPKSKVLAPVFIGRWTPPVLFSLDERPYRHGELRRRLGGVSQHVFTRTLRSLEATGLIRRRVTRSKILAVEYSLTSLGRTIIAPLSGMCRWARQYGKHVTAEVTLPKQPPSDA
jgi:DNA-binding HxlR family transcriptional regulator